MSTDHGYGDALALHNTLFCVVPPLVPPPLLPTNINTPPAAHVSFFLPPNPHRHTLTHRHHLGLTQPPAGPLPSDGSPEWIELRPRWPLTSSKHPKSMPPTLSMKKPHKQAPSLTDMTLQELQQQQQQSEEQEAAAAAAAAGGSSRTVV